MKFAFYIMIIGVIALLTSCSTMKQNISRNQKNTLNKVNSIFEKNGNVFYLTSTYSTISTVWTYKEGKILIYKLVNGKLKSQEEYVNNDTSITPFNPKIEILELDKFIELDGDMFGYKIMRGSQADIQDLSINIERFTQDSRYQSEFLNKVTEDINTYKMWNVVIK